MCKNFMVIKHSIKGVISEKHGYAADEMHVVLLLQRKVSLLFQKYRFIFKHSSEKNYFNMS